MKFKDLADNERVREKIYPQNGNFFFWHDNINEDPSVAVTKLANSTHRDYHLAREEKSQTFNILRLQFE